MNKNVIEYYKQHRLEGWLTKYCGKGPLGGFKKRWLYFNPFTLKLECFKHSTDKIPLDSIEIQHSVLTINTIDELPSIYETQTSNSQSNQSNCNSFRIIFGDKKWILEADNSQDCIKWLQKLQKLRKRLIDKNLEDLNDFNTLTELTDADNLINFGMFLFANLIN